MTFEHLNLRKILIFQHFSIISSYNMLSSVENEKFFNPKAKV